ncbi:GNAT family N-acetyltransferase [Microvirga sp. STR05]|uniref:GNAT family N-acetyltransferase n=1 Tax=Hymenobacter duratus TaxID=2771356 RepID=A0ABR8JCF0_9BACT|nr:GNAT family N-acetyltransferase [Hymenobacter duratus]MBD2714383.1 GNAT family N-acetyltransferase [Hymenobacter duratus]MBR7949286.1 GNAT family N-acetyltransferase [Microvirga sp. STR05]
MSSPLTITLAKRTADVAAQLAAIGRQTFLETFAAENQPADMAAYLEANFSPEKQLAELQDADTVFLLARMNQQLVGYAKLRLHSRLGSHPDKVSEERLEIERLYVQEDWIGTGLGATMMRRALEEGRQSHCRAVVLGVWEKNVRALEFYRRFGFKVIGEHKFVLGTDVQNDLILRKGL